MARLSKTHSFTIFEDGAAPTPDSEHVAPTNTPSDEDDSACGGVSEDEEDAGTAEAELELPDGHDVEADDERRQSSLTSTSSVSSVPDLHWRESIELVQPTHQPYTPPIIRPSFRRPQSVQRMQMTSPRTSSARQSVIIKPYSRSGTPQSTRAVAAKGSPRSRKWASQQSSDEETLNEKQYPLILLQVTLLPIEPRWSAESMQDLLPSQTMDQLQLLRSKISETTYQRGVLIPHPKEDYELLQERLLEALELKQEGMTVCRHFPRRLSTESSAGVSERDADSGMGESANSLDGEICERCQYRIQTCNSGAGAGGMRWTVKVYAANGLMGSSAWAAAWSEMERVDVEILPWISDEKRQRLDEWAEREKAASLGSHANEDAKSNETQDDRLVATACGNMGRARDDKQCATPQRSNRLQEGHELEHRSVVSAPPKQEFGRLEEEHLPMIYRPSQIPISVLLKNYISLLARDRRNVVMFLLGSIIALLLVTRPSLHNQPPALSTLCGPRADCLATSSADILLASAGFQTEAKDLVEPCEPEKGAGGAVLEMVGASDSRHLEGA